MQNQSTKFVNLAKSQRLKEASPLKTKRNAADAGEQVEYFELSHLFSFLIFEPPF